MMYRDELSLELGLIIPNTNEFFSGLPAKFVCFRAVWIDQDFFHFFTTIPNKVEFPWRWLGRS